jgi:hypothetical protein
MKKLFPILLCSFISMTCFSQTYISLVPSLTNTPGTIPEKANVSFELGRQWDVFSLGLDFGKTSMGAVKGRDTAAYFELRPNLNVFQQGKFTNTFTAGIGYIFHAQENLITELTSGIEYAYSPVIHFNVFFGQFFYSGKTSASDATFFGLSAMFYFTPTHPKPLFSKETAH